MNVTFRQTISVLPRTLNIELCTLNIQQQSGRTPSAPTHARGGCE